MSYNTKEYLAMVNAKVWRHFTIKNLNLTFNLGIRDLQSRKR